MENQNTECPYKKNCVYYNIDKSIEYCIINKHKYCHIYIYKEIVKNKG